MKRVLIIKVSSMGDIIHALPALTDAKAAYPDIQFDWVVEPGFQLIPKWHPTVDRVIPLPFRQWRRAPLKAILSGACRRFFRTLRQTQYDAVIDAQGLMKTAWISWFARGKRIGLDFQSARESIASIAYQKKVSVVFKQHAVTRARQLFAAALDYPLPQTPENYAIDTSQLPDCDFGRNTLVFLHGTTWQTKHWPVTFWAELVQIASRAGYQVLLPWGNQVEQARAKSLAQQAIDVVKDGVHPVVLPKLTIPEVSRLLGEAKGIVAVDTGLCHIAAALGIPTVSLYGPTDPALTGAKGPWQKHLKATRGCSPCLSRTCLEGKHFDVMPPCFDTVPPHAVWEALMLLMEQHAHAQKQADPQPTTVV